MISCIDGLKEIWKDIKWYIWYYQVSNFGRVKSLERKEKILNSFRKRNEKILKNIKTNSWYLVVDLCKDWKIEICLVHRLVAKAFILNAENKPHINHKNWIHNDNIYCNLERCIPSENELHSYRILWKQASKPRLWKFWENNFKNKKVNQYTLQWEFIKKWESRIKIERELWYNHRNISSCCLWKLKTAYWFIRKSFIT